MAMADSGIETAAPPDWLEKLETRREKIKGKLGHESGNGAPCVVCGSKCPGLDLHFWRKVCRNCKCRKEQHDCKDDDVTGWAQFEILGAIRSKPAYIKISELTDKPVQLDWIPPNVSPEVAADYMTQLGQQNIPIAGSDAAEKRKQQLEYQVPPHDLDASLCHNLSENEAAQLVQYVEKIKKNCVGQGNVVRIGDTIKHLPASAKGMMLPPAPPADSVQRDRIVQQLINSEPIKSILAGSSAFAGQPLALLKEPLEPDFMGSPALSDKTKYKMKLMKVNSDVIKAAVRYGPEVDTILNALKSKGVKFHDHCSLLGPLDAFRKEYLGNPKFQAEIDKFLALQSTPVDLREASMRSSADEKFNSPLPLRNFARHDHLQYQETPVRKLKFDQQQVTPQLSTQCQAALQKDKVLADILNSEPLKTILHAPVYGSALIISRKAMFPDFISSPFLSPASKARLERMKINTQTIQSAVLNGPYYDELLSKLSGAGINYAQDAVLQPIDDFRDEFLSYDSDNDFQKEIIDFVKNSDLSTFNPFSGMHISHSDDSGFGSVPPTPNYSTYPGVLSAELNAREGVLASIPAIEDMNMYPEVRPSPTKPPFSKEVGSTYIPNATPQNINQTPPEPVVCSGCQQSINVGEVAVKAERAEKSGKSAAWHPQCFKCEDCKELLADLVYFYHGGKVYCARDLANMLKIPRCSACDELIFTKEYTAAEGSTFHIKHFCCYHCDAPLAGQQYIPDEKSNMPLCLTCYDTFFAKSCHNCGGIIGPAEQGVAWGNIHWHGPCFLCCGQGCGKSLIGGRFCVRNEMPFCSPQCLKSVIQ
ncbi:testin [Culex quinquefasciatus]|uniref:Testin n=1 Tax=Culex quinquefasciatus TaxID=7176 RepID=B0WL80_CULQU|nr:testin [Culex quinquefasciatus]|eukprot:XP_001849464.1 testin [Culex quinquefasciatus]